VHKLKIGTFTILLSMLSLGANDVTKGEVLFLKLCWGCHHPTAEAFGPSFQTIARKRTNSEIQGQITRPDLLYKQLGYTRNAMPPFTLTSEELQDITKYIQSFK